MNFNLFYCTHKGVNFLTIESDEEIERQLANEKNEKSDLVKYLQKDDPIGFNDFLAVKYNSNIHHNENFKSLSFGNLKKEKISQFDPLLKCLTFEKIAFMNSHIQEEYFPNLYNITSLNINGKSSGIIDLNKFRKLENINILRWNDKIKLINKNNTLKKLIVWYYNPKSRSLEDLLTESTELEYLEFNLTNIESLKGIEKLTKLKVLKINYGRNLKLVKSINENKITELVFFNQCKRIEDINSLDNRENLKIMNVKLPG